MKLSAPAEKAYAYIKSQIVSRRLYPGDRVIEEDVAKATGVSRTPIRAALMQLSYEGFLEMQPNKGAYITVPTLADQKQLYEVRRQLELGVIALAVQRRKQSHIAHVQENLRLQKALWEQYSVIEYARLNREFHWEIVQATGNVYYARYLSEIYNRVETNLIFCDDFSDHQRGLAIHAQLVQALETRDEALGMQAVNLDIDYAMESLQGNL